MYGSSGRCFVATSGPLAASLAMSSCLERAETVIPPSSSSRVVPGPLLGRLGGSLAGGLSVTGATFSFRPANSKLFIWSHAIFASSAFLYLAQSALAAREEAYWINAKPLDWPDASRCSVTDSIGPKGSNTCLISSSVSCGWIDPTEMRTKPAPLQVQQ